MTEYFFRERLNEGLVRIFSRFGTQLFAARKLRKQCKCAACARLIDKGERAWGDVTSCAMNRAHRICDDCMSAGEAALASKR